MSARLVILPLVTLILSHGIFAVVPPAVSQGPPCGGPTNIACANSTYNCIYPSGFCETTRTTTGWCVDPTTIAGSNIAECTNPTVWCGCDYNQYFGACVAWASGVSLRNIGSCPTEVLPSVAPIPPANLPTCQSQANCHADEVCLFGTGACDSSQGVSGVCRPKATIDRSSDSCSSTTFVCGCDGVSYASPCIPWLSGVSIRENAPCANGLPVPYIQPFVPRAPNTLPRCGGSANTPCVGENTVCMATVGACGVTNVQGFCVNTLSMSGLCSAGVVCGCDGETYVNSCAAWTNGVSVFYEGACAPAVPALPSRAPSARPVCGGVAGVICSLATEVCVYNTNVCPPTDSNGFCVNTVALEPSDCPAGEVCGCDGRSYSDQCAAWRAGVSVRAFGACSPSVPGGPRQQCGGPQNMLCSNSAATCIFDAGLCGQTSVVYGQCIVVSGIDQAECSTGIVCGCDGNTYLSSCVAWSAGVSVAYFGTCPVVGPSTPGFLPGGPPGTFVEASVTTPCTISPQCDLTFLPLLPRGVTVSCAIISCGARRRGANGAWEDDCEDESAAPVLSAEEGAAATRSAAQGAIAAALRAAGLSDAAAYEAGHETKALSSRGVARQQFPFDSARGRVVFIARATSVADPVLGTPDGLCAAMLPILMCNPISAASAISLTDATVCACSGNQVMCPLCRMPAPPEVPIAPVAPKAPTGGGGSPSSSAIIGLILGATAFAVLLALLICLCCALAAVGYFKHHRGPKAPPAIHLVDVVHEPPPPPATSVVHFIDASPTPCLEMFPQPALLPPPYTECIESNTLVPSISLGLYDPPLGSMMPPGSPPFHSSVMI